MIIISLQITNFYLIELIETLSNFFKDHIFILIRVSLKYHVKIFIKYYIYMFDVNLIIFLVLVSFHIPFNSKYTIFVT